ncbi:Histone-lysine N-methyltransferase SETMAR [Ooceraea biroi]|uniref:Histone-lysine N-methyltransferase SETMAR n=1 Tax=Ooceraea biroi TaxID=2015173 RepID=A0A026WZS2_OOCBI|nr:Histone-lysine N-methyltransferase SETMAR [Ooceraea biroi]
MENQKQHFPHILFYYFRKGKNAVQAHKKLRDVYGEDALKLRQCQNSFTKFRSGDFNVKDAPRSGRPIEIDDDKIKALIDSNRRLTTREIAENLNISKSSVENHLKRLGYINTGIGPTEWTYPSTAPSYPAPPVSSSGSYSPLPGGAFSYPGESLSHHPTTEPVPLPTVLSSENQQDTYNCVSMYSGHGTSPTTSLPLVPTRPSESDIFAGGGTGSAGSPGYHYSSWTPGPATPVPVASHNYNPNYQGYYNNPSQNYISPPPMVLYPQLYSTVNQNQIHLHLHGDLSDEQVTIAGGNLTISSIREIGVLGEESEQRNDVWRPY